MTGGGLRGLNGYSLRRLSPLWFKLYLSLFASAVSNGKWTSGNARGVRSRTALAFVVSKARDKEACREYLSRASSGELSRLAYNLFLLSQVCRVEVNIADGEFQVGITKADAHFLFKLIPVSRSEKAPFIHDFHPLIDIFIRGEYDFFDVRNGVVIDVGAYIGDTPVYFAKRGAKKVYAYEPNPVNFEFLRKNVAANGVSGIVVPLPFAVSSEKRSLVVPSDMGGGGTYTRKGIDKPSQDVIYDVPNQDPQGLFSPEEPVSLLKLDCKGCEREILTNQLEQLQTLVDHIAVEVERLSEDEIREMILRLAAAGFRLDGRDDFYPALYFSNERRVKGDRTG